MTIKPSSAPLKRSEVAKHLARVSRYGIDLTEFIESLPPTADLVERQEARAYVQFTDKDIDLWQP